MKKKIIGIAVFLFAALFMFTFANPASETEEKMDNNITTNDKKNVEENKNTEIKTEEKVENQTVNNNLRRVNVSNKVNTINNVKKEENSNVLEPFAPVGIDLDTVKKNAIKELENYLDKENYRENEQKEIDKIIDDAKEKIDNATTIEEINKIKEDTKQELDKVKTNEELTKAEELEKAKEEAKNELENYMKVKLYEGVSYVSSLILLSKNKNMYACAEIGSLAYDGLINGNADYNMAYKYYLIAADKGHPKACYMIANLIYKGFVKENVNIMWKYLNKGIKLGSNAAINLKGLCYLNGVNPKNIINKNKAIEYFNEASKSGYAFAYNNLGYIYEKDNDMNKAIEYYKISADLGNSWALNKMGEYYRNKGDMETAYLYYTMSNDAPINERCKWAKYNLEKYF